MRSIFLVAMLVLGCSETSHTGLLLDDAQQGDAHVVHDSADSDFWPSCSQDDDCDDGLFCTTDACVDGECEWSVVPYFCAIDGVCVPDMATATSKPDGSPCVDCDPAADKWDWTPAFDGFNLGDGSVCWNGAPCVPNCAESTDETDGCGRPCDARIDQ